jgi:hypothetical protein
MHLLVWLVVTHTYLVGGTTCACLLMALFHHAQNLDHGEILNMLEICYRIHVNFFVRERVLLLQH